MINDRQVLPAPQPPVQRRRRRRGIIAVAVILATLLPAGWVALRGMQSRDHLLAAARLMGQLQNQVAGADITSARATLALLQAETSAASRQTRDPLWRLGGAVPGIGDDLDAVAVVAQTLDDLAHNGLPPLIEAARGVDPTTLVPKDGRVDLTALARAAPSVKAADAAIRDARDRVTGIATEGLTSTVESAVIDLRQELERAASVTATAVRAVTLLPPMLGLDRPRTYLVLFQNLAEVRATGGEMGAFAVVRADRGRIEIVEQGTAAGDLRTFPTPVLPLDPAMLQLYTSRPGKFPADVNATPHFPTAAALAREMYRLRSGRTVDAVAATDPVALSYLLSATGPVDVGGSSGSGDGGSGDGGSGGMLTQDNAVRLLLSEVYSQIPSTVEQDRFFANAAKAAFDALTHGQGSPAAGLAGLVRAAAERRILLWSADPAEEELLVDTVLGGSLPERDGANPTVGVFLNDGTGAKLGYYLTRSTTLTPGACRPDGRRELRVAVTLGSTAPAAGLPSYVSGAGELVAPYTLRTNVMVFSPPRGAIVDAQRDGASVAMGAGVERGRAVAIVTVDLTPGASTTLEVNLLTGTPRPGDARADEVTPILWTTPGVNSWPVRIDSTTACPALR